MTRVRFLALALAGLAVGLAAAAFLAPRGTPDPGRPTPIAASPVTGLAQDLAQEAAAGAQSGQREVVLSEEQVNQQLAQHLQQNPGSIPLREPQVRLRRDGRVAVRGITQVAGRETEVQAVVKVDAQMGKLNLAIESAQAGNLPVPPLVAQEIAEKAALAAGLSGLQGSDLPDGIESVAVQEGRLVITRR